MSNNCSIHPESIRRAMEAPSDCGTCPELDSGMLSRRRSRRSRRSASPLVLAALCLAAANSCWTGHAFSSSPSCPHPSTRIPASPLIGKGSSLHMTAVAEPTAQTDFQRRMRGLVRRNGRPAGRPAAAKPANLRTVNTLEEYKEALDEEPERIVVVRFYATWCKACKAIEPAYRRMATLYPHVIFLEVPVTNDNANLHQGLDVPSLPYGHIYHPQAGLVEELKISKRYFHNLVQRVRWYDEGECKVDESVPEEDVSGRGESEMR